MLGRDGSLEPLEHSPGEEQDPIEVVPGSLVER